jgi:hypothetical protein
MIDGTTMVGQSTTRLWITLIAAYVLVLNAGISAYALGIGHLPAGLDAFGNPLCLAEHVAGTDGGESPMHGTPTCCAIGCATAGWSAAPATADMVVIGFSDTAPLAIVTRGYDSDGNDRHDPGRPRAPPLLSR